MKVIVAVLSLMMCCSVGAQTLEEQYGLAAIEARQTHGSVDVMALGEGMKRVYVFLPAEPAVTGKAPFVFFHHGWQGMNPKNYGALLDHLAREGNVVVFPVYQETDATSPQVVVEAAAAEEREALHTLKERGVEPDLQRVVYYGYSMGAAISLSLAVAPHGLPKPDALVLVAPGDAYHVAKGADAKSIWPVMTGLPVTLPVAVVTGEDDHAIGLPTARKLMPMLCRIKADRRVLLVLPADEHDGKKVGAGHGSPGAPDSRYDIELTTPLDKVPPHIAGRVGFEESTSLNQLDFYGYWKVLDAVLASLASGPVASGSYVPPAVVFKGGTPGQSYMGVWPDGTLYKSAHVENPCSSR